MIELIPRFSYSIHQQQANPKKAYAIDTATAKANSLSFSKDTGHMLENAVFIQLRRNNSDICYFRNEKAECDFLIKFNEEITQVVQVCQEVTEDNMRKEISGVKEAMLATICNDGIILTLDQEDELDGIPLIPAWKWMGNIC